MFKIFLDPRIGQITPITIFQKCNECHPEPEIDYKVGLFSATSYGSLLLPSFSVGQQ
jgi:hypothetical protein